MFVKRFSLFLAPSLFTMVVSFVMVPVTTYVLGPGAFGVYGLMTALIAVGWTVSLIGSGAVCNIHFLKIGMPERRRLISTLLVVALAIAATFCVLCLTLWPWAVKALDGYAAVPLYALLLSLLTVMFGVPWMVAQDVITLDGRATEFAAVTIVQTLTSALVTVTALYRFHAGVEALFLSALAGAAVTMIGALWILRSYFTLALSRSWALEVARIGTANAVASVSDAFQVAIERGVLASMFGVSALGLYVHAQNYRVIIAQVLNAAARPLWPVTLSEAGEPGTPFLQTRVVWDTMYVGLTAAGVTFAVFGRYIIGWLTHGRFVDAHVIVPYLVIFLLVQNAGKPQTAILFRDGVLRQYYWIQVAANVTWFLCLLLFIRVFGLVGGVLALIAQQLFLRLCVQVLSRRRATTPFADGWLAAGIAVIASTIVMMRLVSPVPTVEITVWCGAMGLLLGAGANVIRRFVRAHAPRFAPGFAVPSVHS